MDKDYLQKLWSWTTSKDSSFEERYSFESWSEKLGGDEQYRSDFYNWVQSKDNTFSERRPFDDWSKLVSQPQEEELTEEMMETGQREAAPEYAMTEQRFEAEKKKDGESPSPDGVSADVVEEPVVEFDAPTSELQSQVTRSAESTQYFAVNENYLIDGSPVSRAEVFSKLFDQRFLKKLNSGESSIEIKNDPEMEQEVKERGGFPFKKYDESDDGIITPRLMSQEEEDVVPYLNYQFGDQGFAFEESGTGDNVVAKALDSEGNVVAEEEFALDLNLSNRANSSFGRMLKEAFTTSADEESNRLKTWLDENQDPVRKVEAQKQEQLLKFKSKEQVKTSFEELSKYEDGINESMNGFIAKRSDFDNQLAQFEAEKGRIDRRLELGTITQQEIDAFNAQAKALDAQSAELSEIQKGINASVSESEKRRTLLKKSVGKFTNEYLGVLEDQGNIFGAIQMKLATGIGKIGAGNLSAWIDVVVEALPESAVRGVDPNQSLDEAQDELKKQLKADMVAPAVEGAKMYFGSDVSPEYMEKIERLGADWNNPLYFMYASVLGAFESIPAMVGPSPGGKIKAVKGIGKKILAYLTDAGNMVRATSMAAQVSYSVEEEMAKNPAFKDISENEKRMISAPIAIVGGVLENLGFRNIVNKSGVLQDITMAALKKAGKKVTAETFEDLVQKEVKSRVARGALVLTSGALAEAETGMFQEISEDGLKRVYNAVKGKEMFDTEEAFSKAYFKQVMTATLQEAIGGMALGSIGAISSAANNDYYFDSVSDVDFDLFTKMSESSEFKTAIVTDIKNKINSGEMTAEQGKAELDNIEKIQGALNKIPSDYSAKNKKKALSLLMRQEAIKKKIDGKDKRLTKREQKEIDKIDGLLDKVDDLNFYQSEKDATVTNEEVLAELKRLKGASAHTQEEFDATKEQLIKKKQEAKKAEVTDQEVMDELTSKGLAYTPELFDQTKQELLKAKQDAIQKQSTEKVDAQEPAKGSEEVGEGDTEKSETTIKAEAEGTDQDGAKVEVKEEIQSVTEETLKDLENVPEPVIRGLAVKNLNGETLTDQEQQVFDANQEAVDQMASDIAQNEQAKGEGRVDSKGTPVRRTPKTPKRVQDRIRKQARRAKRALSVILPDVKIVMHDNFESFVKALPAAKGKRGVGGAFDNKKTIHINLESANARTVAHEIFHAAIKRSIKSKKDLSKLTDKMLGSVLRGGGKALNEVVTKDDQGNDVTLKQYLEGFAGKYKESIQSEEQLAEMAGFLADHYMKMGVNAQTAIKAWIAKAAKFLSLGKVSIFNEAMSDKEAIDLLNTIAGATATGKKLRKVKTLKEVFGDEKVAETAAKTGIIKLPSIPKVHLDALKDAAKKAGVSVEQFVASAIDKTKATYKNASDAVKKAIDAVIKAMRIDLSVTDIIDKIPKPALKKAVNSAVSRLPKVEADVLKDAAKKAKMAVEDFVFAVASKTYDASEKVVEIVNKVAETVAANGRRIVIIAAMVGIPSGATVGTNIDAYISSAYQSAKDAVQSTVIEMLESNETVSKAAEAVYDTGVLNSVDPVAAQHLERALMITGVVEPSNEVQEVQVREEEEIDYANEEYLVEQTYTEDLGSPTAEPDAAKFRVQFPLESGKEVVLIPTHEGREASGKKQTEGVQFIMHQTLDYDPVNDVTHDYNSGYHRTNKSFDGFVPVLIKKKGERGVITYKRYSEINDSTDVMMGPLRQFKFTDLDWDGNGTPTMASAREINLKNGKKTPYRQPNPTYNGRPVSEGGTDLIWTPKAAGKGGYGKFQGGGVVFIFEDSNGNRFAREFAGSINAMKAEGESIAKTFGIPAESITIGTHDVGSFSKKLRAENGVITNEAIDGMNSDSYAGGAVAIAVEETGMVSPRFQEGSELLAPNGKPSKLNAEQHKLVRTPAFKKWFGNWETDPKNASKVVDENGEPLVVYHGSPSKDIEVFDRRESERISSGLKEFGTYFSTNPELSKLYSEASPTKESEKRDAMEIERLERLQAKVRSNQAFDDLNKKIEKLKGKGRIYPVFLNLREIETFDGDAEVNIEAWGNLEVNVGYKWARGRDAMEALAGKNQMAPELKVDGIKAENIIEMSIMALSPPRQYKETQKYKDAKEKYLGDAYLVFDGQPENIKLADGSNKTFDAAQESIKFQDSGPIKATIDFKNRSGRSFSTTKKFNDEQHMNNYIKFMERKGNKEIGVTIEDDVRFQEAKLPTEINEELNKIEEENYNCSKTGDCILAANDVINVLEKNNISFNIVSGLVETNKLYEKGERGPKTVEGREVRDHVWIELEDGTIIDLSKSQFNNEGGIRNYNPEDGYTEIITKKQFESDFIINVEKQTRPSEDDVRFQEGASSAAMFENPEVLNPKRMANGRTKVIELARAFDKRAKNLGYHIPLNKSKSYTDSQIDQIAEAMADDAELQLKQDDSGIGWYDLKTSSAMELMSRLHPELSDANGEAYFRFTLMVAIISQNNTVDINFKQANEAYTHYKDTGTLPKRKYAGTSGELIGKKIALGWKDISDMGFKAYKDLLKEEKTRKEWERLGYKIVGENMDTKLTGAMVIFGSKIGSFWGNLNGDFSTLTADLWFSRMFNRYTGNTVANDTTKSSEKTLMALIKAYRGTSLLYGHNKSEILKGGKVFDAWLNDIVKEYADSGYKAKNKINVPANTHFKNLQGLVQDVPRGGNERNAMRSVVQKAQDKLVERGYPKLDIADIQAIVWYNEKDLYRLYKAVNKSSEKTDYETAAQKVLRSKGIDAEVALPFQRGQSGTDGDGGRSVATQSKTEESQSLKFQDPSSNQYTIFNVVNDMRGDGYTDSAIALFLSRQINPSTGKKYTRAEVKDAMAIPVDIERSLPPVFGDVEGGVAQGQKLFVEVMTKLKASVKRMLPKTNAKMRAKAHALLKSNPIFKEQSKVMQNQLLVALDQSLGTTANQVIQSEIAAIKRFLSGVNVGEKQLRAAQARLKALIRKNLPQGPSELFKYKKSEIDELIRLVAKADSKNIQDVVDQIVSKITEKKVEILEAEIENILETKTVTKQSGRAKGQSLDVDFADTLEGMKKDLADAAKDIDSLESLIEKLSKKREELFDDGSLSNKTLAEIAAIDFAIKYLKTKGQENNEQSKVDALQEAKAILEGFIKGGRSLFKEQLRAAHESYVAQADAAFKDITGIDLSIDAISNEAASIRKLLADGKYKEAKNRLEKLITNNEALFAKSGKEAKEFAHLVDRVSKASKGNLQDVIDTVESKLEQKKNEVAEAFLPKGQEPTPGNLQNSYRAYMNSKYRVKAMQREANRNRVVGGIRKMLDKLNMYFHRHEDVTGLMDVISKSIGDMFGGYMQESVTDRVDDASYVFKQGKKDMRDLLESNMKRIFGKKWKKITGVENTKVINTGLFRPNKEEIIVSQNQIYYLYNMAKDPANEASFENMWGKDWKSIMEALENLMTPEVKEWADWQVDEFYPQMYERYNETYRRVYRTNLPWNQFYSGKIHRDGDTQGGPIDMLDPESAAQYHLSVAGGSTKMRQKNSTPIMQMDGNQVLTSYILEMERFRAFQEALRDISKMLNNKLVSKAIVQGYGQDLLTLINRQMGLVATGGFRKEQRIS